VSHATKDAHLYCCGPARMLNAFEDATTNLPSDQVHLEHFAAKEKASLEGDYVVELARSGREFKIPPSKSILAVLRDAGVDVPYSCEDGVCGACECAVISGDLDHRDSVLTKTEREANKTMMICCSGCRGSRLVLDL
jgi:ferredoxin